MTLNRLVAASFALTLAVTLASCSPFSDFVSDNWPHFAGGEPDGLPPRPGTPGYAQFIAHGQPTESANSAAGFAQPPAAGGTAAMTGSQKPAGTIQQSATLAGPPPQAPPAPAEDRQGDDAGVVRGGLY
jgi:hypothetical protein